ncbi:MAG: transcriptional regulator [Dermatophilaceae bacterium]
MSDFEQDVTGIGTLADPVRRELYLYVCAQPGAVGRDEAATAVGVAHHKAKFHLDRLEAEGLLVTEFARLTGRSGPGAGRPAKLYRRAERDITVSLPGREYEMAGHIMADAIAESMKTGCAVGEALESAAASRGRVLGAAAASSIDSGDVLADASRLLAGHGYEPRTEAAGPEPGDGQRVVMANCPFHSLTNSHSQLVCEMNHALLTGLADSIAPGRLIATLEPAVGRCCVVLREAPPA